MKKVRIKPWDELVKIAETTTTNIKGTVYLIGGVNNPDKLDNIWNSTLEKSLPTSRVISISDQNEYIYCTHDQWYIYDCIIADVKSDLREIRNTLL